MKTRAGLLKKRKRPYGVEATREHLVSNARELFRKKGFKDASIGQLIAQAGGSKETVYRHFRNKDALLKAVFEAELKDYVSALEPLRHPPDDVRRGLTDLAEALLVELTSDRSIALHQMLTAEAHGSPDVGRLYYTQYVSKGYELGEHYLKRYQASGDLKPLDSMHLNEYFGAMLIYRAVIMRQSGVIKPMSRAEARRLATRVVGDFLDAFGT
jgi:TetR/AcrR family transcriptional regulator, mexJK operon transcriptional repressor